MSSQQSFSWEDPFRPIYEYYPALVWLAAAILAAVASQTTRFPPSFTIGFAVVCLTLSGLRGVSVVRLYREQRDLEGQPLAFMTRDELDAICERRAKEGKEPALFLGYGFDWSQDQTQKVHLIRRSDPRRVEPVTNEQMGQPWIHGLGMSREEEIWIPLDHTSGHTLLVGTTRAGKTRLLDLWVAQAVRRGEPVIIWDPKGDKGLSECAQKACIAAKRPNDYIFFSPAFPEISARIDPLANFSRATELATRVASLIASETNADPFTAFSQKILTNLCEGLLMIHQKPNLVLLKRYVDSGPDRLVIKASETYFAKVNADWAIEAKPFLARVKNGDEHQMCIGLINFYRSVIQRKAPHSGLEGLYGDFEHDKSHQVKMTASLSPVLTMLTAGPLADLLSPDPEKDDPRPITDFNRVIRNNQVCYIGLDSLSDNMVGSAIGSMFVADMTAVSGTRYNFDDLDAVKTVNLVIDEAAELVSDRLIQLLNKSGGAKFRIVIATQTFADFAARMGSADKARQFLGNLNNVIALRIIDADTQTYVAESLPEVYVRHIEYTQATGTSTNDLLHFNFRHTEAMKETAVPMVEPQLFGCLPNLQFFARVSGGHLKKVRSPILVDRR
jgi:conjugal transfer pilus assembly protein TraD